MLTYAQGGEVASVKLKAIPNNVCDHMHQARTGFQDVTRNILCALPAQTGAA
jgi:hypothetical protein